MAQAPDRTECPQCGKSAWRTETRESMDETVVLYYHNEHQFEEDMSGHSLACSTVTPRDPGSIDWTRECSGPGCDEMIDCEVFVCSDECREAYQEQADESGGAA